jgi:Tex protein YqgF-like domain
VSLHSTDTYHTNASCCCYYHCYCCYCCCITGLGFTVVSEAGASVWSVSPAAAAEFPNIHCSQLGAVSIGRRLLDPLSELVKVEPAALGTHHCCVCHSHYHIVQRDLAYLTCTAVPSMGYFCRCIIICCYVTCYRIAAAILHTLMPLESLLSAM